jgi:hypothetical protein
MELSKAKLQTWLDEALRHLAPKSPQHIHIDQLGASEAIGEAALLLANEAYTFVLERLGDRTTEAKAVLFLPLSDMETFVPRSPSREQLIEELGHEPPSVYLLSREVEKRLYIREEYRVPYELSLPVASRPDVFTWYRIHRSETAYREGWEYSQHIMLEHYPAALR